jgi:hypothetical protein
MSTESELVRHEGAASSLQNNNSEFNSSKAIILSELNDIQREQYYNLILSNNVKICYSDKKFVANVRLLASNKNETEKCEQKVGSVLMKEGGEGIKRSPYKSGRINDDDKSSSSVKKPSGSSLKTRRHGLLYGTKGSSKMLSFHIAGVASFDYSVFSRFCSLIGDEDQTVRPKLRSVSWLMRIIEDIYDARFAHEKSHVLKKQLKEDLSQGDDDSEPDCSFLTIFPVFTVQRLATVIGLKVLSDQIGDTLEIHVCSYHVLVLVIRLRIAFRFIIIK